MIEERNQELVDRVRDVGVSELRRFLMVAITYNNQHYWTEVERIEHELITVRLHGFGIPMSRTEAFIGMEVYDDNGQFVCSGFFDVTRHTISGDVLNLSHRFVRVYPEEEFIEVTIGVEDGQSTGDGSGDQQQG